VTRWLVTGGAGYIGSHVATALLGSGREVTVLDDLSSGHADYVPDRAELVVGSVTDAGAVAAALAGTTGVVHLAGYKYAGESVRRPVHTWSTNTGGTLTLLAGMQAAGVSALVFSSTAAVYGTPDVDVVDESTPTAPQSPYGASKLAAEWAIADAARAGVLVGPTCLRYFNVVGCGQPHLVDTSPHNLFPLVMDALVAGVDPVIFGTDYPTPDGTCVRDYVHVADVADAHAAAVAALEAGTPLAPVYNLGSGAGTSVRQIMDMVAAVTGRPLTPREDERRPGDPARIVASGAAAAADLDWAMRRDLRTMVASAWAGRQAVAQRSA